MQISGATAVGIVLVAWVCGVFAFVFGVVLEMVRRAPREGSSSLPHQTQRVTFRIGDAKPIAEVKRIPDEVIVMAEYAHYGKSRDFEADVVVEFRAIERVHRR